MKGMSLIVKAVTRVFIGFITVYSLYIIAYGHLTPGGGFSGGTMWACGFILLVLAFGKEDTFKILSQRAASVADCLAALAFLLIAILGISAGGFFVNFLDKGKEFDLVSAGTLLWSNIAIGIKVSACLFGVFVALAIFKRSKNGSDVQ